MGSQVFLALGAVFLWATFVFGAIYLDAKLGGWHSLAARYPLHRSLNIEGQTWSCQSIVLANGGSGYRGILTLTTNSIGMAICAPFFLRSIYPDLFLPWKDVTAVRESGWLWDKVHLTFSGVPDVPVTLDATLVDKILSHVGPVFSHAPVECKNQRLAGPK